MGCHHINHLVNHFLLFQAQQQAAEHASVSIWVMMVEVGDVDY